MCWNNFYLTFHLKLLAMSEIIPQLPYIFFVFLYLSPDVSVKRETVCALSVHQPVQLLVSEWICIIIWYVDTALGMLFCWLKHHCIHLIMNKMLRTLKCIFIEVYLINEQDIVELKLFMKIAFTRDGGWKYKLCTSFLVLWIEVWTLMIINLR